MKKIIFFFGCLVSLSSSAQLMHLTFGGYYYKQAGTIIQAYNPGSASGDIYYAVDVDEKSAVPGAGFFYYKYFVKPGEKFSAGVQTGLGFYAFYEAPKEVQNFSGQKIGEEGGTSLVMGYFLPVYAMARFGSQATEDVGDGLGASLGAGINLYGFNITYDKGFMVPFAITAELMYSRFGIRFDMPLKKFESHFPSYTGDIPRLKTSFFSVQLSVQL